MSVSDVLPLLHDILSRLGNIEVSLGLGGATSSTAGAADVPRAIRGYDEYAAQKLVPFVEAANKLGGDAAVTGQLVQAAWDEMRAFLYIAATCKEPPASELPKLLGGVAEKIRAVSAAVKRNEWEKHVKTASEGVQALNWLVVKPAPRDFIESYVGGSDYWANGIRKEYRTTNPDQVAYCETFKQLLLGLMDFVKEYHTTGVSWNARGIDVSEYAGPGSAPASAAPAAAAAAAPAAAAPAPARPAPAPVGNIFGGLAEGESVTAGLKKVTKEMQTWRAEYQAGGAAPAPAPAPAAKKATPAAAPKVKGPPVLAFQEAGSKWQVENQTGPVSVTINDLKETVYIYGCVDSVINVVGKCKSIIVDSCKKTQVHFDNAFASFEVVNCQRVQVHCREQVSAVAIDKTDGIVVFLPATSLDSKIVASKSSEMNLSWPDENGDLVEKPIPEQFVHQINSTKDGVTADVSDLYGH